MIPYVNARLTAITAPGTAADYDAPAGAGTSRWTGAAGIYVAEQITEVESPGRVDEVLITRVEVPSTIGRLIQRGDSITYTYDDASRTRTVEDLARAPLVGRVRLALQDAI